MKVRKAAQCTKCQLQLIVTNHCNYSLRLREERLWVNLCFLWACVGASICTSEIMR